MPRMCSVYVNGKLCGKTYSRTIKRSHSMRASIRRLSPNLQYTRVDGQRVKACTSCIKAASNGSRLTLKA